MSIKITNTSDSVLTTLRRVLRVGVLTLEPKKEVLLAVEELHPHAHSVLKVFNHLTVEDTDEEPVQETKEVPEEPEREPEPEQSSETEDQGDVQESKEDSGSAESEVDTQSLANDLSGSTNKDALIQACSDKELDTSGTKYDLALRLVEAGVTEV